MTTAAAAREPFPIHAEYGIHLATNETLTDHNLPVSGLEMGLVVVLPLCRRPCASPLITREVVPYVENRCFAAPS